MRAKLLVLLLFNLAISTAHAAGPAGPLRPTWDNLGGTLTSDVTCTSWQANRIDCFARGTDNALHHVWWGGASWSRWESLGGILTSNPECVSWGPNRIDCFARGQNGALWHTWWGGAGWGAWEDLGGELTSPLSCVTWGPNRIDCFALDQTRALSHKQWDGNGWANWVRLGRTFGADATLNRGPECISWAAQRIDCFLPDSNTQHAVWHIWRDGANWGTWENVGGFITSGLSCTTWGVNRIDCFGFPQLGSLRHAWFDGAWHAWEKFGGNLIGAPGCVANRPPRIDCLAFAVTQTTTANVQRTFWTSAGWSALADAGTNASVPSPSTSHPECLAIDAHRLDCFVVGANRELLHRSWLNPARPIAQPGTSVEGH